MNFATLKTLDDFRLLVPPTRIGAASAAGVPKPLAPSIKKGKAQPTIISCATLFCVIVFNQSLIVFIAPLASIVLNKKIAPQIIKIGVHAVSNPLTTFACTRHRLCLKIKIITR